MSSPIFSVITTGKNERDSKLIEETFDNWETAAHVFDKKIEFILADAGNNCEFPKLKNSTLIDSKIYEEYRKSLYRSGIIKKSSWDSPSIGRNLGFRYAKGRITIFQDIDSLFSTGTELDYRYVSEKDRYENYFEIMYNAFKKKNIVAAAPSSRARDSKKLGRRFGTMGQNYITWLSVKLPTVKISDIPIVGPSVPGCSISVLKNTVEKMCKDGCPYDPELAIAEDHKFSRLIGEYGRISYEKDAGIFIRTLNRVSGGLDFWKSLYYAILWAPYYSFPNLWKYKKHGLSI